jgi:Glyoxalase-like domain
MGGPRLVTPRLEVGIDCADPAALAPLWLAAFGYARARGDGDPCVAEPVALVERLTARGARRLGDPQGEGAGWLQVMADREGNEFCV